MIEGIHRKNNQRYVKSELYIIEKNEIIEQTEPSGDHVTIRYEIREGQHGLYANEFRPRQVPKDGAKVIDLSMGIDDFKNKKCIWGLYDLKRTLGAKDVVIKLCGQWQAALRYWYNCVLNNMDNYTKNGKIGVVATKYDIDKVDAYIVQLENELERADKLKGSLAGAKNNVLLPQIKKELKLFRNFREGKFVYLDPEQREIEWKFDVIISEHYVFEWKI